MAFDPDHCKRCIATLQGAIRLLTPYDGKQIRRLSEANREAYKKALSDAFVLDAGNGNLRESWFTSYETRAWNCNLGMARVELKRLETMLAAYEMHAVDPLVANVRDLTDKLKAAHKAIRDVNGVETYNTLCRLGMLGNVVFTC